MRYGTARYEQTRFQLKIRARGDCYEWTGAKDKDGYGLFKAGEGVMVRAHRYAYSLAKGHLPTGAILDHLCRHVWCVRPTHLEVVSTQENIRRGETGKWQNRRTHCPQGHERTQTNTIIRGGKRACRLCIRIYRRDQYLRRKRLGLPLNGQQYKAVAHELP